MRFTIPVFPRGERVFDLSAPVRELVDVPMASPDPSVLRRTLIDILRDEELASVGACGAQDLWRARKDSQLRKLLQELDLVVPRGVALQLVVRAQRHSQESQPFHPSEDWFPEVLLESAVACGSRVFFLGGHGEAPFDWARRALAHHPGLRIAGAHAPGPDFRDAEGCRRLLDRVNGSATDLLIVLPGDDRAEHFSLCYRCDIDAAMMAVLWGGAPMDWSQRRPRAARPRLAAESEFHRGPVHLLRD